MSNRPDNPFQQAGPGTMYGDQAPKPRGSNTWLWVLGIIGGIMALGGLVCCGGAFFAYRAGTGAIAEVYKSQLNGNPVIVEHVGTIEAMSLSLTETSKQAETSGGAMAFNVTGSKSSAVLLVKQAPGGDGTGIQSAELLMPDGSRHPIPLDQAAEFNIDDIDAGTSQDIEIQLNEFANEQPAAE